MFTLDSSEQPILTATEEELEGYLNVQKQFSLTGWTQRQLLASQVPSCFTPASFNT